jgi:aldehyde dehydrogenase (NAD+)
MLQQLTTLRNFFNSGATQIPAFRIEQLKKLKAAILKYEQQIHEALYKDLKKSPEECWITETGMCLEEINYTIKHLQKWVSPVSVSTNLLNLPSTSKIIAEPLGVVLIIGPWNFPFQLLIKPLIGAVAAGNCVVLKPSEFAGNTEKILVKIINEIYAPSYILPVQGSGENIIPAMMNNFIFDHVFYTGSTSVGKIIYKMAAENLVPVTLELGGKSPAVVDYDANIKVAAKRIVLTKFSNCGQMCISPDYVLVHETKKEELVTAIKKCINEFYLPNPAESYDYGKMINEKQFNRVVNYITQGELLQGGSYNKATLYIEPTIIDNPGLYQPVMKEEIFGPVLPILTFKNQQAAIKIIEQNKNPLAFYIFTNNKLNAKKWLQKIPSGGACVNNTSWHFTNNKLPFGGRGFSGTGAYHGKFSFNVFSHKKAVMQTPAWFDPALKYPSFKGRLNLLKWLVK